MILVVGAMQAEIESIEPYPNTKIILTGIGKVNAAMHLTEAITENKIDAIYNFGFVGASHHYQVGDVIIVKDAQYHDFDLTFFGYEKGQVPNCPVKFESDPKLLEHVQKALPEAKTGSLFTGDYFMTTKSDEPYLVDMEGTALYQVAYLKNIPIISVKIVSDIVGMDDHYKAYKKFESSLGAIRINDIYHKILK